MSRIASSMTATTFRRIALGLSGATEGAHMNHPDFRAGGKIFATLNEDQTRGMVKLAPEQQAAFLRDYPAMFAPASGAWGQQGCTMVDLRAADEEMVGETMTLAWRNATTTDAKKGTRKNTKRNTKKTSTRKRR